MFKLRKKIQGQRGFTMIELIFVVIVLAILAVGAIPLYGKISTSAKETRANADLKTLSEAVAQYYGKNAAFPDALTDLVTAGVIDVVPKDAFKNTVNYGYTKPTTIDGKVTSVGEDGLTGTADDIERIIKKQ